jgi:hypothetical protein
MSCLQQLHIERQAAGRFMRIVASRRFVEVDTVNAFVARYHHSFGQSRVFAASYGRLLSAASQHSRLCQICGLRYFKTK